MLRDTSPRAVWQHSNNKNVHRSQSTRSPAAGNLSVHNSYHSNSTVHSGTSHSQRIYNTPPNNQSNRPYGTINRNRPSTVNVRINDGTHPRMPMRAMQPQTYHGMPVQVPQPAPRYGPPINYDRVYNTLGRQVGRQPYPQGQPVQQHTQKTLSHGDMRGASRSRIYSDTSQSPAGEQNNDIRSANSDTDISSQRMRPVSTGGRQPGRASLQHSNQSIPSGQYHASSSMTSLPQYAQLMTPCVAPVPTRSDSAGNIRQRANGFPTQAEPVDTRHSYSSSPYSSAAPHRPQNLGVSKPPQHRNSSDDVFSTSDTRADTRLYPGRGNTTPTSPVSRQPSYLTAMSAPIDRSKLSTLNLSLM